MIFIISEDNKIVVIIITIGITFVVLFVILLGFIFRSNWFVFVLGTGVEVLAYLSTDDFKRVVLGGFVRVCGGAVNNNDGHVELLGEVADLDCRAVFDPDVGQDLLGQGLVSLDLVLLEAFTGFVNDTEN